MTPHKKALLSEYFTVGWNVIEGIIAIAAGMIAGSIVLVGFGLDSYIEVASGLVLIWRLVNTDSATMRKRKLRRRRLSFLWELRSWYWLYM